MRGKKRAKPVHIRAYPYQNEPKVCKKFANWFANCKSSKRTKYITMATLTYYLDTRSGSGKHPLKLRITQKKKSAYIGTGIKLAPDQWYEEESIIINHDKADTLNAFLLTKMKNADAIILRLDVNGITDEYSAVDLKKIIENNGVKPVKDDNKKGNFLKVFMYCMEAKKKYSTQISYYSTLSSLRKYDPLLDIRSFEDIDVAYLESYDKWMSDQGIRQNSRNVYYRNIRTVFNRAIDDEITTAYPFRKFKLKKQATKKRSLTIDELRTLRDYPVEDWQRKYVDLFFLMFYLIGINAADLLPAKKKQVRNGRLEYERAKTYKAYSIKIEPEAQKLIDKYKGKEHLLSFCDEHSDYKYILQRMSKVLKTIGPYERKGRGGKKSHTPLFPDLSQYWCRHTWATLAAELDIPKETIAAALGHDMGNPTTAIYINFNQKKVDEANRKIIDFLNEK